MKRKPADSLSPELSPSQLAAPVMPRKTTLQTNREMQLRRVGSGRVRGGGSGYGFTGVS